MKKTLLAIMAACSIVPFAACDNNRNDSVMDDTKKTGENAGEVVDEAADDTGRAAEEAAGSVTDSEAKNKARKAEHTVEDTFD